MLLKLLDRLGRKRIVMDRVENEPYLERYYLFLRERNRFPFNIFLHKFLKSDPDDVHDHPWPYATPHLVLTSFSSHSIKVRDPFPVATF